MLRRVNSLGIIKIERFIGRRVDPRSADTEVPTRRRKRQFIDFLVILFTLSGTRSAPIAMVIHHRARIDSRWCARVCEIAARGKFESAPPRIR